VTLSAAASTGDLVDYRWTIGPGSVELGRQVTTVFPKPGIYAIRLTVEDAAGRVDATQTELLVYARSGTRIFSDDFADGPAALGRWPLDPTWASQGESGVEFIAGGPGYTLYIHSGTDRLHRRAASIELPPLRIGQRFVFFFRAMTLQNQDGHTFVIAPARSRPDLPPAGLPYFLFSSGLGGSYMREPSLYGTEAGHPLPFKPSVYQWHDYQFTYSASEYVVTIDGVVWQTGPQALDLSEGGTWWIVVGDESQTEACRTYYDDILVSVEE
jgi:PKD repeat protein